MKPQARAGGLPVDYRLPRRAPSGFIGLAIVTAALAVPFIAFIISAVV
jgi:hypothetical protein